MRWLLINGRTDEAERILGKAARWNKKKFTNIENLYKEAHHLQTNKNENNDIGMTVVADINSTESKDVSKLHAAGEKYNIIDILKNPELRIDTLILWYAW